MPEPAPTPACKMCRVVLIDHQQAVRELLGEALQGVPACHYEIVGLGGSGQEALELCRRWRPDVLVLEMVLPDRNGVEVLGELRRERSGTRVVLFTGCEQISLVSQAIDLGASGYVLKSQPMHTLLEVLARVCAGGSCIDPLLLRRQRAARPGAIVRVLTRREREVARLIAQGQTTKEAAAALGVSTKTLDKHRSNLMRKLGLHDVVGLTHYAFASGLISLG